MLRTSESGNLTSGSGQDLNGKRRDSVVSECLLRRVRTKDNPFLGNRVFGNKFRKLSVNNLRLFAPSRVKDDTAKVGPFEFRVE